MKTKNKNPAFLLENITTDPLIEFYFKFNHLKQLFRQGWLLRGIPEEKCETVADHLFAVALLTWFIAERYFPDFNLLKLLKMMLVHELGEIYIGDITPSDHVPKKLKSTWELRAIQDIFSQMKNGKQYIDLWIEYDEGKTPEAKLLRQIDYLEMAFQAAIYDALYKKNLEEFFVWTRKRLKNKILANLLNEADKIRKLARKT